MHTRESLDTLLAAIQQKMPEVSIDFLPLGYVSKCYLGATYEVHTLDRIGNTVRHYKVRQARPPIWKGRAAWHDTQGVPSSRSNRTN